MKIIPNFTHHYMPLLSVSGQKGQTGGPAHALAVREECRIVDRIGGSLVFASRTEVAVIPAEPDLFIADPKQAKARDAVWKTVFETPNLLWCVLTRNPGNATKSLPPDWAGKGYKNVCIGFAVETAAGLAEGLNALRAVNARWRMLHVLPSAPGVEWTGGLLDGIDWVVFSGTSADAPTADAIRNACLEASVAFLFHRTDGEQSPAIEESSQPAHPFGPEVLLNRPALQELRSIGEQIIQDQTLTPDPVSSPDTPNPPESIPDREDSGIQDSGSILHEFEIIDGGADATECSTGYAGGDVGCEDITQGDREDFTRLDDVVRHNLRYFIDAGRALMEIRTRELWRAGGHPSWAEYCQAVGGLTKVHANRLIRATVITDQISKVEPIGSTPVAESQIRPLFRLGKPELCAEAWSRGVERAGGQQPTAKQLCDVVAELMEDERKAKAPKSKVPKTEDPKTKKSKPEPKDPIAEMIGRIFKSVRAHVPYGKIEKQLLELKKALGFAESGIRRLKDPGDS